MKDVSVTILKNDDFVKIVLKGNGVQNDFKYGILPSKKMSFKC